MASTLKSLAVFLPPLLLLISSSFFTTEARPLAAAVKLGSVVDKATEDVLDGLYVEAIKTGGPNPGGKGHKFTHAQILGDVKNSAPSPRGKGHKFTDAQTLVVKNSGPSPGEGH